MNSTKNNLTLPGMCVALLLSLLVPAITNAQVTFRTPLNTGTAINNMFDNDQTPNTKLLYNCTRFAASGKDDNHRGVDFPVANGTSVIVAGAGTIYQRENTCSDSGFSGSACGNGYGNHYRIDHEGNTSDGSGLVTIYAHMQAASVNTPVGTPVSCGQAIGLSAASGDVTGPHLHFEPRTNGLDSNSKTDPYAGSCSHPQQYWNTVSNGQPTTQCYNLPLAPSTVSTSNPTATSIRVHFRDNALNETSFPIERRVSGSASWTQIANFGTLNGAGSWYYTSSGLSSGTTYCYRLRTTNAYGSSQYSPETCGTTTVVASLPSAPSGVNITNATFNSLRVNFTDNATNETSILLERKIGTSGTWIQITSFSALSGTATWYWDNTGLSSATTYCYRLRAQNASGVSGYSNEACGTTQGSSPGTHPPAPSNVSLTNPTSNSLQLNFTDNASNETDIRIERKVGFGGSWVSLGGFGPLAGASTWYWVNTGLAPGTTYCYRLYAVNGVTNSPYSNEACGTTF